MEIVSIPASTFVILLFLPFVIISCKQESPQQKTAFISDLKGINTHITEVESKSFDAVKEDTYVLVTVDTENISEETKNENVFITDNRSDSSENNKKPEEHVALVDKNMKIFWSGEAKDPSGNMTVDIVEIRRKAEGGAEILDAVFRDPNKDGIVIGKIKNKKVSGLEYYNIVIRVNGDTPKTYVIDPKIQMIH